MRRWSIAACVCFVAGYAPRAAAQHALLALPLDDPAYVQLDVLARGGCRGARVSAFRPYLSGWIRSALDRARSEQRCQGRLLEHLLLRFAAPADSTLDEPRLRAGGALTLEGTLLGEREFRPLWRDVRGRAEGTPPLVARANGRVTWDGGPHVLAVADAYAVSNRRNDPTLRGQGFRGSEAVVDFAEASLSARVGPLELSVGRGAEAWLSDGRESLMLSAHGPPLDRVTAGAVSKRWQIRALVASLPDVVLTTQRDSILAPARRHHRMLVAHAVSARPFSGVEFVLGETALVTREGGGADLAFVNPMMVYLVTQNDVGYTGEGATPANLTTFAGARWSTGRSVVEAELTIDDIQIDQADRKNLPDQLGWRVHGSQGLPISWPATVGVEYRRVDSYTYLRSPYSAVYQQYDAPLGSELGPDSDDLRVTTELLMGTTWRISSGVSRRRRGALRLEGRPGQAAYGHAGEPFPSTSPSRPAVQIARSLDAGIQWLVPTLPVAARLEWTSIVHVNNTPTATANYFRVNIVGSYRFRYP